MDSILLCGIFSLSLVTSLKMSLLIDDLPVLLMMDLILSFIWSQSVLAIFVQTFWKMPICSTFYRARHSQIILTAFG